MKKDFLKKPLAVKLILGLAAFTVCLIPLQILLLFMPLNRWVALLLKLICGHVGVIVLFKWLRKHPAESRPAFFPGLVKGALIGGIAYLAITVCKFILPLFTDISSVKGILDLVRVLCPVGGSLLGAWLNK